MAGFAQTIATAYAAEGAALDLGRGVHDGAVAPEAVVTLPLRMVNRHGLIAGATGTGKTKTLQGIAEQLSRAGVPVLVSDVKGDLSGVAAPGTAGGAAEKRAAELGLGFEPLGFPVEFLSLGGIGPGVPIRATARSARLVVWYRCRRKPGVRAQTAVIGARSTPARTRPPRLRRRLYRALSAQMGPRPMKKGGFRCGDSRTF